MKPGIGLGLFLTGVFLAPPMGLTPSTAPWMVLSAALAALGALALRGALFGTET